MALVYGAGVENFCEVGGRSPSEYAQVAELADALASGASNRKVVEVQILSGTLKQNLLVNIIKIK